jgi:hypothetical protein
VEKRLHVRDAAGMICAIDSFLTAALEAEPPQLDVLVSALDLLVVAYNNTCQTEASEDEREVPKGDYPGVVAQIRKRFPELGVYGTVYNPLAVPPESPLLGDAADDIADIMLDLSEVRWRSSEISHEDASWHFRWTYEIHWGRHLHAVRTYLHA